ncbi:MAG: ATP-binding protein, partial [Bacteroidota bacterium]
IYTEVLTKAPDLITVSFWDIINDLLELMEEHIYQVDAKVQVGQIPHLIKVDGKFFHLLWQHLLQNALEYRQPNKQLQITITGHGDEDNWYFSINDNGRGIPPDEKDTLFDLFRHVHFNENQHHTGLGLPLVKQIVEQHQGQITVESQVNVGTKITIQIPRNQPQTKLRAIVPANRQVRNNQQRSLGGS